MTRIKAVTNAIARITKINRKTVLLESTHLVINKDTREVFLGGEFHYKSNSKRIKFDTSILPSIQSKYLREQLLAAHLLGI